MSMFLWQTLRKCSAQFILTIDSISVYSGDSMSWDQCSCSKFAHYFMDTYHRHLARDRMHQHSAGAEVLRKEIYVDDVLSGGHSIFEAYAKQQSVTKLLKLGDFVLRKYLSNKPRVLNDVPVEDIASYNKSFPDNENFSVLGLSWQPVEDMIYFSIATTEPTPKLTKRIVLSRTSKLFDPLGWLDPVVIIAKMLMQF